jgi:hypothetical protein
LLGRIDVLAPVKIDTTAKTINIIANNL